MPILIFSKEEQASGNFNDGEILEKKPIGFPQDKGELKPYSNLFYWADAWTPVSRSTIGLHPHQGFEICSFVIEGSIKHFDSQQNKWIELKKGDAQIIRSGNGISHAEEILDNSRMFQIWFDPNISKTITQSASYSDYKYASFPLLKKDNRTITTIKGRDSPFKMDSEEIEIYEIKYDDGFHEINLDSEKVYSFFIKQGNLLHEHKNLGKGTFIKIEKESKLNFKASYDLELFEIRSPLKPSYPTYHQRFN
jgi:hypothetical protein